MDIKNHTLIVVCGPTAVGKTAFSIELARKLGCEIVNADSRQLYSELKIGVSRPSEDQLKSTKHHLIASHSILDKMDAMKYTQLANRHIEDSIQSSGYALLVGGTGLYIKGVTVGLDEFPTIPETIISELEDQAAHHGLLELVAELHLKDPKTWESIDRNNPRRVIRALSVIRHTQKPFSDFLENPKPKNTITYDTHYIYLDEPRELLRHRIASRLHDMIQEGLEQEVESLKDFKHLEALHTVGYREWWPYFEGLISKKQVIETVQIKTGQYAKRQQTWFNKYIPAPSINLSKAESLYL